ncbi:MAG: amidohydrolase [Solirubrobacterales bacterium]|nr:amidohydrolase [Solirubrobacterales bacterium]
MSLAVIGAQLVGAGDEPVGLRSAADGTIAELGAGVQAQPGDEVIDGAGMALLPGFVNGHTHAAMTLFRGYADDLPLMEWLENHIWPAEAKLEAEDVYWGTRLACAEMIRTGTVRFWDMYWQPGATARAVSDAGLRVTIGAPLIDGGDAGGLEGLKRNAAEGLGELEGADERFVAASLAPHAIYTVSPESLSWIAAESERLGLPVQIHISETEREVQDCVAAHGVRPVELLERVGLLGRRTLLAHAVWLDEREREMIAAAGSTIVTNPAANMKLAVGGSFDLPAARRHGIPTGLGTDGAGSNNSLDLLADAKHLALLQKHQAADAAAVTAAETLAIATGERAPLLGGGELREGGPADFLLVRTSSPELALGSLPAALIYASSGSVIDTTVVAGRPLMQGGRIDGIDEVVAKARERAARLGLR